MHKVGPNSGLSILLLLGKTNFPPRSFSLTEAQLLTQEEDLHTTVAYLSLSLGGSKFLASVIAEEVFTSPFIIPDFTGVRDEV